MVTSAIGKVAAEASRAQARGLAVGARHAVGPEAEALAQRRLRVAQIGDHGGARGENRDEGEKTQTQPCLAFAGESSAERGIASPAARRSSSVSRPRA